MQYKITHSTKYQYSERVPVCHNQLHLGPRDTPNQACERHRITVHPVPVDRDRRLDFFGNQVEFFSILEPHTRLTITSTSRVTVKPPATPDLAASLPWEELANSIRDDRDEASLDACQFVFASPRVPVTRRAAVVPSESNGAPDGDDGAFATAIRRYALESFQHAVPVAQATRDLTRRIHADFSFDAKATSLDTPVQDAFAQRHGVCQDFAHIQLACLRALGLPARYVSGYLRTEPPEGQPRLVGADVSHAWVAVYCGELGWIEFDPTNDVIPSDAHITLGWGRDYDDVCPVQGVFLGGGQHSMTTSVDVEPVER